MSASTAASTSTSTTVNELFKELEKLQNKESLYTPKYSSPTTPSSIYIPLSVQLLNLYSQNNQFSNQFYTSDSNSFGAFGGSFVVSVPILTPEEKEEQKKKELRKIYRLGLILRSMTSVVKYLKPKYNLYLDDEYIREFTNMVFSIYKNNNYLRNGNLTKRKLNHKDYKNEIDLSLSLLEDLVQHCSIKKLSKLFGVHFNKLSKKEAFLLYDLLTKVNNPFKKVYGETKSEFYNNFKKAFSIERIEVELNSSDLTNYDKIILPMLSKPLYKIEDAFIDHKQLFLQEKYDGERVIIRNFNNDYIFYTRNGTIMNPKKIRLINVHDHFKNKHDNFILDGEMLYVSKDTNEILPFNVKNKYEDDNIKAIFMIFDVIQCNYLNCINMPYEKRFNHLKSIVKEEYIANTIIVNSPAEVENELRIMFAKNKEGIILRPNDYYKPNVRALYKIKKLYTENKIEVDLAIVGASYGKLGKLSILHLGGLLNNEFIYITKCSNGLTEKDIDFFNRSLPHLNSSKFDKKKIGNPDLICDGSIIVTVIGDSWSDDGSIRFPIYKGMRLDKDTPDDISMYNVLEN